MKEYQLPLLTIDQLHAVVRLTVEEYGITLRQMVENAGRNLALLAKQLLDNDLLDRPIVVLAGRGHNGAGGLVAARHLLEWGAWVQLVLPYEVAAYHGLAAQELQTLQALDAPLAWAEEGWELPPADLVIDALIGHGLNGDPNGKIRDLIHLANSSIAPILSLEAPSGLNITTGILATPHIRAATTMAVAMPQRGLLSPEAKGAIGDLFLADSGVPPVLYEHLGLTVPPFFAEEPLLPVHVTDSTATITLSV